MPCTRIDSARRIVGWNRGAEKMFGHTEAEILGRDCSCLYIPEDTREEGAGQRASGGAGAPWRRGGL